MSSGFYNNSYYINADLNADWANNDNINFDSSAYVYDSPQLEDRTLGLSPSSGEHQDAKGASHDRSVPIKQETQTQSYQTHRSHIAVPQDSTSHPSSLSDGSSRNSSSPSATKQLASSTSPSPATFDGSSRPSQNTQLPPGKVEGGFPSMDPDGGILGAEEPMFRSADTNMNMEMDNLSLQSGANFNFNSAAASNALVSEMFSSGSDEFASAGFGSSTVQGSLGSPPKTVQPNKTFIVGSREDSPNEMYFADKESPSFALHSNSPLTGAPVAFGGDRAGEANGRFSFGYQSAGPSALANSISSPSGADGAPGDKWPCPLTIDPIPDKSRVETQIPIRMTLHQPPSSIKRVHLPTHTISKPKFQQKPPFDKSSDSLELSVLLVCASAMQNKKGALERAFQRAESSEVPVRKEETGSNQGQQDENDPERPLNGGPVSICAGCTVRERKRAARKKTKKPEEEEEWLKDESKRVVVFNCAEVRDWCLPDAGKETPVKEHSGPVSAMVVSVPMRIACYCRHQQEKIGFQVIFTLKTSDGAIVAQAISDSIMITDDHKQPIPQPDQASAMGFAPAGALDGAGMFFPTQQQYAMYEPPPLGRDLPFRPSLSTPDLRNLPSHFAPQLHSYQRQLSSTNLATQPSTASATPRNLSRPASPTNPAGQPGAKKRRSGGSSTKVPSHLHMTSVDANRSPHSSSGNISLPSAPTSAGFNFTSPTSSSFGPAALEQSMAHASLQTHSHFASGPPTPLHSQQSTFVNEMDPSQYFSAPTSQHTSRAPSPSTASRIPYGNVGNTPSHFATSNPQNVPAAAADALASLPAGFNLSKPPTLQRLIPSIGPRSGGEEVTVLGSGFFQGLEVMFGDAPAVNTTFWGDTTLVCRAPTGQTLGAVPVCFRHQHRSAPHQVRELQNLMPTRLISYTYYDDGGFAPSMQGMQGMIGLQSATSYPGPPATGGMNTTPPGSGSVSPPTAAGGDDINMLNAAANINPRAFLGYMGQTQSPTTSGPGSAGFNPASFARSQHAQHEAAQAVAAGRRMAPTRTVSGGPGAGR